MKADLTKRCKKSKDVYEEIVRVPNGRVTHADILFDKLPESSPLRNLPREEICQAYLSANSCLHGNTTNNMAEICNFMLQAARSQEHLFSSMQAAVHTLKQRQVCIPPLLAPRCSSRNTFQLTALCVAGGSA